MSEPEDNIADEREPTREEWEKFLRSRQPDPTPADPEPDAEAVMRLARRIANPGPLGQTWDEARQVAIAYIRLTAELDRLNRHIETLLDGTERSNKLLLDEFERLRDRVAKLEAELERRGR